MVKTLEPAKELTSWEDTTKSTQLHDSGSQFVCSNSNS